MRGIHNLFEGEKEQSKTLDGILIKIIFRLLTRQFEARNAQFQKFRTTNKVSMK